ncbi:MAG TPA: hypothetical protein DIU14_07115 [Actinobacteria bacterium]|nr:hypothetical protein [Actinomycetota bacterium]
MAWLMAALAAALVVTTACGPPARSPARSISNGIAVDVTELSHIYTEDMPILEWSNGQTSLGRLMVLGEAPPPDLCGQPPSMVGAEAVALGS